MAKRSITPNDTALHGNPDGHQPSVILANHWAKDLVLAYSKVCDPFSRQEIICEIVDNSSSAMSAIDSIAKTISSLEFNIVPLEESDYLRVLSKTVRNELLSALGRLDGYDALVHAFVYDLLVKPTGFFGQYVTDGNGRPIEIGTINSRNPRPYFENGTDVHYSVTYNRAGDTTLVEESRSVMNAAGIWWVDGGRSYALPSSRYKQSVDGARGNGAFLVGRSLAEKHRVRIWLSSTLEEYIQRVTSGTDESGLLILNNLAWRLLIRQIEARKKSRKENRRNEEDEGTFLYAVNKGVEVGDAKWVSFRPFPEGIDFLEFMRVANDLVASSFGIKTWRVDSSDSGASAGKFGNAKRSIQMDAQEPTVQWVMSRFQNFINNIYLYRIPLAFTWGSGSSANDSIKIDNQMRIADAVTKSTYLNPEEQRLLAIYLGTPRDVVIDNSGIASSASGITKTVIESMCKTLPMVADRFGVDTSRIDPCIDSMNAAMFSEIDRCVFNLLGKNTFTKDGVSMSQSLKKTAYSMTEDVRGRLMRIADDPLSISPTYSLEMMALEFYKEASGLLGVP